MPPQVIQSAPVSADLQVIDWKGLAAVSQQQQQNDLMIAREVNRANEFQQTQATQKEQFNRTFADQHALLGQQLESAKQQTAIGDITLQNLKLEDTMGLHRSEMEAKILELKQRNQERNDISESSRFIADAVPQRTAHDSAISHASTGNLVGALRSMQDYTEKYTPEFSKMNSRASSFFKRQLPGSTQGFNSPDELAAKLDATFGEIKTQLLDTTSSSTKYDNSTAPDGTAKTDFEKAESRYRSIKFSDIPKMLQGGTIEEKREAIRILSGFSGSPDLKENAAAMINRFISPDSDSSELRLDRIDASLDKPRTSIIKQFETDPGAKEALKMARVNGIFTISTNPDGSPRLDSKGNPAPLKYNAKEYIENQIAGESPATQAAVRKMMEPIPVIPGAASTKVNLGGGDWSMSNLDSPVASDIGVEGVKAFQSRFASLTPDKQVIEKTRREEMAKTAVRKGNVGSAAVHFAALASIDPKYIPLYESAAKAKRANDEMLAVVIPDNKRMLKLDQIETGVGVGLAGAAATALSAGLPVALGMTGKAAWIGGAFAGIGAGVKINSDVNNKAGTELANAPVFADSFAYSQATADGAMLLGGLVPLLRNTSKLSGIGSTLKNALMKSKDEVIKPPEFYSRLSKFFRKNPKALAQAESELKIDPRASGASGTIQEPIDVSEFSKLKAAVQSDASTAAQRQAIKESRAAAESRVSEIHEALNNEDFSMLIPENNSVARLIPTKKGLRQLSAAKLAENKRIARVMAKLEDEVRRFKPTEEATPAIDAARSRMFNM